MQMAAIDRRLGMIRRGSTPAAPKPINLPSQKLENQGLFPDVELVPRGTCCWGGAGRVSAASGKNCEKTDSAPSNSATSKVADTGTDVENDVVQLGLDDGANPSCAVESVVSVPDCIAPVEAPIQTTSDLSSFETSDANLDKSPAASDAGSLSGSSIFECGTSPSVSPVAIKTWESDAKVEEQKYRNECPTAGEGLENVLNFESKQGTCSGSECLPGCQDFGYFEGFYSNNHTFFSPGMLYSNGEGMAFGAGLPPEPSQHDGFYSFLGVPYYDSTKDKEIVVITMVGNPGLNGNYIPQPSLPDQYGRPTMFGNFPLQFGHFGNVAVPGHGLNPMSSEMNSLCSGEQGEAFYEQGYYEDNWLSGSSIHDVQNGNGAFWHSSFPMCKNTPKRAGRQKSMYRNRRAAPKEALSADLKPERKVTLLTKVSQHEVIISSMKKTSKLSGNRLAGDFTAAPSFENMFTEALTSDSQCESDIAESSSADKIHELVDMDGNHVLDVSRILSAQGRIPQLATCTRFKNEDSALLSNCDVPLLESKAEASGFESSSTTVLTSTSHALGDLLECHEDSPKKGGPTCEVECVSSNVDGYTITAAELTQDPPIHNSTESPTLVEQANKQVSGEGTLCTTAVVLLSHKHNESLSNQKSDMKWRRKGVAAMAKLGQGDPNSKAQGAVVDKKASSLLSVNDNTIASSDSSLNDPITTKAISQCDEPLPSWVPDSCSASEGSAAVNGSLYAGGSLHCAVLDSISNVNLDCVTEARSDQKLESSSKIPYKTQPLAEAHDLNSRSAPSCGFGKEWRPKLAGAGHGKLVTKASSPRASKAIVARKVSKPEEVSCDEVPKEKYQQQQQVEGGATLPCEVDRQEAAELVLFTCATAQNSNKLTEKEQNVECHSDETMPSSNSKSDNPFGLDQQLSKISVASSPSSTTQMQAHAKFTKMEGCVHLNQESINQPMVATQLGQSKNLNREVNISSKAALGLRQHESFVTQIQEQKQFPVEKVPQGYAGHGPIVENTQRPGLVAKSVLSFGRPFMKQSPYIASQGGRKIGFRVGAFRFKRFNQNYGHPQETQRNLVRQFRQKVWCCKVVRAQEHWPTVTCNSLAKPFEECRAFSGGRLGTENKQHSDITLQCASRFSWKPKQMPLVQVTKEKCKKEGKGTPSSFVLQKKRAASNLTEYSDNTSPSLPSGNKQQVNKQASLTHTPQMKDPSCMCPLASCNSASQSPLCGSGPQVENMGNQGLTKPASPSEMAVQGSNPAAVPSASCESGRHISNMDKKGVFGPASQPVSVVAMSLKPEDGPLSNGVMKPHQNYPSWKRKTPLVQNIAGTSALSKESNENDPSVSAPLRAAPRNHTKSSPASISATSDDLHALKSNGRHPVRASYHHLQKPIDQQVKFQTEGTVPLELPNKASSEAMNKLNYVKISSCQLHPDSKLKFSQHHVYAVKEAHFTASKQHPMVNNRRPFSMKSNFSHDDNEKVAYYQGPLSHVSSPVEQGSPFFRNPNFLYVGNKRAFHRQHTPNSTGQIKMSENSHARGLNRVDSLGQSRCDSDVKPVRHGQLHSSRKFADSDKKGWVVKTKARCGDC